MKGKITICVIVCLVLTTNALSYQSYINVYKDSGGQGGATEFNFSGDLGAFMLHGEAMMGFGPTPAGTYDITEIVPTDWTLINISINDPGGESTVDLPNKTATIVLNYWETVEVTFVNELNETPPPPPRIPAPGAILLGGIGVGLVGWLRRRRSL